MSGTRGATESLRSGPFSETRAGSTSSTIRDDHPVAETAMSGGGEASDSEAFVDMFHVEHPPACHCC